MKVKILENLHFFAVFASAERNHNVEHAARSLPSRTKNCLKRCQKEEYMTVCGYKFCNYFSFPYICTMSRTLRGT